MPSDVLGYHRVLLNKEILSAITTCWAIRLTVNTFDRTMEIYLNEPLSYQRYMPNLTVTSFYLNKATVLPRLSACRSPASGRQRHLMSQTTATFYMNHEIVLSAFTTFWAIRLTTFNRNKEVYLTGPISYQRAT